MTMKTNLFALFLLSPALLVAAPLTETTAVYPKPDLNAPAIGYLKAGTEPTATADSLATAPAGWMAVELPGPFDAYVRNGDITKGLDVHVGSSIYIEPAADAAVLTTMERGDKAEITGLRGPWTQIHLEKKITGYLHLAPVASASPAAGGDAVPPPAGGNSENGGIGKPAPSVDQGSSALPRLFQGKLVSTRRPFAPRRPYDYQLNDDSGARFAYLDVSRLLQTEQIGKYADRTVVIYGTARNDPEAKGIVIAVESLELK
jgi:hypothetical protein